MLWSSANFGIEGCWLDALHPVGRACEQRRSISRCNILVPHNVGGICFALISIPDDDSVINLHHHHQKQLMLPQS